MNKEVLMKLESRTITAQAGTLPYSKVLPLRSIQIHSTVKVTITMNKPEGVIILYTLP